MTSGRNGSISIELIAIFVSPSPSGRQVVPLSSLFHIPPETPAANNVVGIVGWKRTTRVRPPMFPGPSGVQASRMPAPVLDSFSGTISEPDIHTRDAGCANGRSRLIADENRACDATCRDAASYNRGMSRRASAGRRRSRSCQAAAPGSSKRGRLGAGTNGGASVITSAETAVIVVTSQKRRLTRMGTGFFHISVRNEHSKPLIGQLRRRLCSKTTKAHETTQHHYRQHPARDCRWLPVRL